MIKTKQGSVLLAVALVAIVVGATTPLGQRRPQTGATSADLSRSLEATARTAGAAVVRVVTTSYGFGQGLVPSTADLVTTEHASGSGAVVDPDGYIITNAHVVRGALRLRVEVPMAPTGDSILARRSRLVDGQIVGLDQETDLAVIKIAERNLPALAFGDSEELKAGQLVLAMGSPLGLHNSVSLGVVSAVARQLEPESPMIYVQTDAAFNPGSSGGPLIDMHGRLVGINTLVVSQGSRNEGLGFAAPSNIVRAVYEQIKNIGHVRRGDIGVFAQTVTPVLASGLSLARDHGVVLADVKPGTPAARAGLHQGDLVLALDGKPMENGRQLHVNLYRRFVGEVVTLEILRDGQGVKVPVAMAERVDPFAKLSTSIDPRRNLVPRLGILGVTLDREVMKLRPSARVESGVVVVSTVPGAIESHEGGLTPGDIVYAVNRTPVNGLAELRTVLEKMNAGDSVVLHLDRGGGLVYLAFTID